MRRFAGLGSRIRGRLPDYLATALAEGIVAGLAVPMRAGSPGQEP